MNIELLDYNKLMCDGSECFSDELNIISHTILDIIAQPTHSITIEEKKWALGLNAWLDSHNNNPDINPTIRAYKSVKAKTRDIEERIKEDEMWAPYYADLTQVLKAAFEAPGLLSEEDRKRLAQFFWHNSMDAVFDNQTKTIEIDPKRFNFESLSLDGSLLELKGMDSTMLTNTGCVFYCEELRRIMWDGLPSNANLKREVKIFKNPSHAPIYQENFNSKDYTFTQIHMIMASIPEHLKNSCTVEEVEECSGKNIDELFFNFICEHSYDSNPQDAAKYRALYEELRAISEPDKREQENNLKRILELYKSSHSMDYSFCLSLIMINKFSQTLMQSREGQNKNGDIVGRITNLSNRLGDLYNNPLRADLISFATTQRDELLSMNSIINPFGSQWGEMRVRFALKHINHSIISQKAIAEKMKLEDAIGVLGQKGMDNQINDKSPLKI